MWLSMHTPASISGCGVVDRGYARLKLMPHSSAILRTVIRPAPMHAAMRSWLMPNSARMITTGAMAWRNSRCSRLALIVENSKHQAVRVPVYRPAVHAQAFLCGGNAELSVGL